MRAAVLPGAVALLAVTLLAAGCGGDDSTTTSQVPATVASTTAPSAAPATPTTAPPTTAPPTTGSPTTATTMVTSTVPASPAGGGLTLEQVRNAEITVGTGPDQIVFTLVDGAYRGDAGGPGGGASGITATMSDVVAFGDLDEDEIGDAAFALTIRDDAGGGTDGDRTTASEYVVALVSDVRGPAAGGCHLVGVGARVDSLAISAGEILVEATVPGPEDSSGVPSVAVMATLQLPLTAMVTGLLHTAQTSETPGGDTRKITITSPETNTYVINPCVIKGTVTIAPFENNLVYRAYDINMVQLAEGPVTVDASGPGAPGTFELPLDLEPLSCAARIFVTVSDLSVADGSILAMDSIELVIPQPT